MKKILLCIATSVMAMGAIAQIQVNSNGTVVFPNNVKIENTSGNIYLPGDTDIRFGCDATWASPKWAVEYFGGGLNFWKPNNPAGSQDYLFFLSDNGRVGIGCGNSPYNKLHVVGNVYIQAATGSGSLQIQTGATDPLNI
ncbi:MAG: hypothetical protein MJ197_03460 [Bacteroidales bacterium]|nr:hypothetical protein [Bacteroidales bacterium]